MPHYTADNPEHIGTLVFLDGKETSDVTECDTDEGWVVRYRKDIHGDIIVVNGCAQTDKLFGCVEVVLPPVNDNPRVLKW